MNTRTTALHTAIVALTMTLGACATPQQTTSPEQRAETRGSSELEPGDGVASSEAREVKLIVDLIYEGGIANMRYSISNTAEYGDLTRGPMIIDGEVKKRMKVVLDDIQSGRFTREWVLENKAGQPSFNAMRRRAAEHPIEEVGEKLRGMMPWISANRLIDKRKN